MKTYVVYDLESTCVDSRDLHKAEYKGFKSEIIEIGAVKVDSEFNVLEERTWLVKPELSTKLSTFCTELTTITNDMLFKRGVPTFKTVGQEFEEFCKGSVLLSWGAYDKRKLKEDLERVGLPSEWVNNHVNAKKVFHNKVVKDDYKRAGARLPYKYRNALGLQRALTYSGLTFTGTQHRGIDDARNTARLLKKESGKLVSEFDRS